MMDNQQKSSRASLAALIGLPVLMFVCCGLPLILGAIGLTAAGAFILGAKDWIITGAVVLMGLIMLIFALRRRAKNMACCAVPNQSKEESK